MSETKEKILMTALRLFARDGYEAVSVRMIAGELGITKGALYKHYKNKRDIFDSIVERMYRLDAEKSREHNVPEEKRELNPEKYENVSLESLKEFTVSQFLLWTEDEFASDFRKMLALEQYRSAEMMKLYASCFTSGPVAYTEDIFREMIKNGVLKEADPKLLAVEFFSPLFLLINSSDGSADRAESVDLLNNHIDGFIRRNTAEK
ncbi:MAG: TetR/AcrR family transcriptional regulator [Acutalibacteraceae bacterium]